MKRTNGLMLILLVMGFLLAGCGPSKQVLRLQRQVEQLQREKQTEVARLQQEKFEAMQVRSVALERRQKRCRVEVVHMRKQHNKVSRKIAKATRKIQRLLMEIVSDTMLMPLYDVPPERQQQRSVPVVSAPSKAGSSSEERNPDATKRPQESGTPSSPPNKTIKVNKAVKAAR